MDLDSCRPSLQVLAIHWTLAPDPGPASIEILAVSTPKPDETTWKVHKIDFSGFLSPGRKNNFEPVR